MVEDFDDFDDHKKRALVALDEVYGIISKAAVNLKIHRSTLYNWMEADPKFKAAVEQIREVSVDHVESKLFQLIDKGDMPSTIFFMKTRGKKRGYVERTEITGADGGAVQINLIMPKGE